MCGITDNNDGAYDLYIGSDAEIYSKNLQSIFNGMSGVQTISFNNLNTSETTDMKYTFEGCTSLINLDLSTN